MDIHYILDEQGNPVPIHLLDESGNPLIENLLKWSEWLQTAERHVGDNTFPGDIRVSTVFLSIPHVSLHSDAPMLYETMVFADEAILQSVMIGASFHNLLAAWISRYAMLRKRKLYKVTRKCVTSLRYASQRD